eukprot:396652-Rhodomonas_salina.2
MGSPSLSTTACSLARPALASWIASMWYSRALSARAMEHMPRWRRKPKSCSHCRYSCITLTLPPCCTSLRRRRSCSAPANTPGTSPSHANISVALVTAAACAATRSRSIPTQLATSCAGARALSPPARASCTRASSSFWAEGSAVRETWSRLSKSRRFRRASFCCSRARCSAGSVAACAGCCSMSSAS